MKKISSPEEQEDLYKKLKEAGYDVKEWNNTELKVALNRWVCFSEVRIVVGDYALRAHIGKCYQQEIIISSI
jgi:hypothetical protein